MNTSSALITGGAGFIGTRLANTLQARGVTVAVYDNFSWGRRDFLGPKIHVVEGDILDKDTLASTLARFKPDVVFHLAALAFIPYCNEHPEATLHCNVEGTHAVLEACLNQGVPRALVASSGAIYADDVGKLDEQTQVAPFDVYGLSKQMAELCARYFATRRGLDVNVARFFNTYGSHETQDHLIPAIIRQLKAGDTLQLGNLETRRSYIYIDDLVAGLIAYAGIPPRGFTVANIGVELDASGRELVELIARLLGRTLTVETASHLVRANDKRFQTASAAYFKALTGWEPQYTLESGLRAVLRAEGLLA